VDGTGERSAAGEALVACLRASIAHRRVLHPGRFAVPWDNPLAARRRDRRRLNDDPSLRKNTPALSRSLPPNSPDQQKGMGCRAAGYDDIYRARYTNMGIMNREGQTSVTEAAVLGGERETGLAFFARPGGGLLWICSLPCLGWQEA
jgi:hypothetical protein